MNSAWSKFTLANLQLDRWRSGSFFYRLIGSLAAWRGGSWLLQWSEPLGALLISLVLILAPFVSTELIGLLLFAIASYWLILTIADNDRTGITPIHILLFFYWCIATVAVALSPVKSAALDGLIKLTLYLTLFALTSKVFRSPSLTNWITAVLLLVALVVSCYGIRQEIFGAPQLATWNDPNSAMANDIRVYSYLGNPNLLAGYLLAAIAFSLAACFVWQGWVQKFLAITMLIVNSACMYFTDSRGGWMGMLASLVVFLLLLRFWYAEYLPHWARKWLLPVLFGSMVTFLLVVVLAVEPLRLRIFSIFAGRSDSSNNFRMNVWKAVSQMIHDRPFLGIGPGNEAFNKVYPRYMESRYSALSAYSIWLETIVETGFVGFTCLVWSLIVTINQGIIQIGRYRPSRSLQSLWLMAAIAAMTGLMIQGCFDTVWYRPQIATLWWLMLGLIASKYEPAKKQNNSETEDMIATAMSHES
jgi:putative inorganic carbon (HCO3(-)) transporter